MRRALLAVLVACGSSGPAPVAPADQSAKIAAVERGLEPAVEIRGEEQRFALADRMREYKIPAVSIAVFDNYELQWARGYGVVEAGGTTPVDAETTFLAGSISKPVNALGVLLAVAAGTLDLDKPINDQLTSWKLPDNELTRASPVTLRKLLSHTAGTTVHGFPGYAAGAAIPTVPQILDGAPPANTPAVRVDLAPGSKFRYSGGGTTISMLALTDRTKRPYPEYMAEHVLGPLGMTHSSYEQTLTPERLAHAAVGHGRHGTAIDGKRHTYPEMAAAGLWTTPTDLAKFLIEIAKARAGKPSKVSREIAMQMTTKVADADGDSICIGMFLSDHNGVPLFGHNGADEGFQAYASSSMDGGRGVVIMASSDNGFQIFNEIERAVYAAYGWPGQDKPIERFALTPDQRAKLVGAYTDGARVLAITDDAGTLHVHAPFNDQVELVPIAADTALERTTGNKLRVVGDSLEMSRGRGPAQTVRRLTGKHPLLELEAGRFDDAVAAWRALAVADAKVARDAEQFANNIGYQLMERDRAKAVEVLRSVAVAFPESSNAHDSLGEAYGMIGDKPKAIAEYEAAIKTMDADPRILADRKAALRKHAEEELAKLRK